MKNFIKLFVVVLVVAFVFISCEKGGTIEVVNKAVDPLTSQNLVIIVEGIDVAGAARKLASGDGTIMVMNQSKTFSLSEDGTYTVVALYPNSSIKYPIAFYKTVILAFGSNEKVTIKE